MAIWPLLGEAQNQISQLKKDFKKARDELRKNKEDAGKSDRARRDSPATMAALSTQEGLQKKQETEDESSDEDVPACVGVAASIRPFINLIDMRPFKGRAKKSRGMTSAFNRWTCA